MRCCGTLRDVNPDTPDPERPFRLAEMAGAPRRRTGLIALIAGGAVAVVAAAVIAVLVFRSGDAGPAPEAATAAATPAANGIKRPDPSCVTTDGKDHQDLWNANGWWAGRVDGEAKEMASFGVLGLKLNGHQINSVWICAPRPNG